MKRLALVRRIGANAVVALLLVGPDHPASRDSWFGRDKVKHFLMSALVQSTAYSVGRIAGLDRSASQIAGASAAVVVGVGKELHDRRQGGPFSRKDLTWDAAGALAAASVLNGAR